MSIIKSYAVKYSILRCYLIALNIFSCRIFAEMINYFLAFIAYQRISAIVKDDKYCVGVMLSNKLYFILRAKVHTSISQYLTQLPSDFILSQFDWNYELKRSLRKKKVIAKIITWTKGEEMRMIIANRPLCLARNWMKRSLLLDKLGDWVLLQLLRIIWTMVWNFWMQFFCVLLRDQEIIK